MKNKLLIILLLFTCKVKAQDSRILQFESYKTENQKEANVFVEIKIDSSRLITSYFSPNKKKAKLLKWNSYKVDSIKHSSSSTIYSIFCGPFEYEFSKTESGQILGKKIYYGRVLKTFQNQIEFEVFDQEFKVPENITPFLLIQNPQFDYFVKGRINRVSFSQYGVPISDLAIKGDNCVVESKNGSANISEIRDSIVTLYLVNKNDDTIYYSKQFVVKLNEEVIPVSKNYFDLKFNGGEISTLNSHKLISNKTNTLYLANWEKIIPEIKIQVENGKNVGYKNGVLQIIPNNKEKVKVIITEKETGYVLCMYVFDIV